LELWRTNLRLVIASIQIWNSILKGFRLERRDFAPRGRYIKLIRQRFLEERYAPIDEAKALSSTIGLFEGKLTIILDEVDGWIERESEKGWQALDQLRAMTDHGMARVILVGYELLNAAAGNDKFPLAGRGEKYLLGPLNRTSMNELVLSPLAELGIRLDPENEILERIWQNSSGMPHIVQDLCSHLVSLSLGGKQHKKILNIADLKAAINNSHSYRTFRRGIYNSDFPLAEAIAGITSIKFDKDNFWIKEVAEILEDEGYSYDGKEFELALSYLELRAVIHSLDSEKTLWGWVSTIMREGMKNLIQGSEYNRWLIDVLERHKEASWKKTYKILGRL
jgi:hypothetical protein